MSNPKTIEDFINSKTNRFANFIHMVELTILMSLLVITIMFLATPAQADEGLTINLGGISYHMSSDDTNTYFHRGLVFQRGNYLGGYLKNSYGQDSWVGAYKVYESRQGILTTEVFLGAVRGYDKCYGNYSDEQKAAGKDKVEACFIPIITVTIETDTIIQPQLNLWGDALVLTGKYKF